MEIKEPGPSIVEIRERVRELSVDLKLPILEGDRLMLPDLPAAIRQVASAPLFEFFESSLPDSVRRIPRRTMRFTYSDRWFQSHKVAVSDLEEFLAGLDNTDFESFSVYAESRDKLTFGREMIWNYHCLILFGRHAETGQLFDQWGGLSFSVFCPAGKRADLPENVTSELRGFLVRIIPLLGITSGGAIWQLANTIPPEDFGPPIYGPHKEWEALRAFQWLTLLGPKIVEKLGGVDALEASVFHAVDRINYLDGRVGALVQMTDQPEKFDREDSRILSALASVLPPKHPR